MKKLSLLLLVCCIGIVAFGKPISEKKAALVASNFVFGKTVELKSFGTYGDLNKGGIYIINFMPEGWALVASDDAARPVIGYSPKGYFNSNDIKYNLKDWLDIQKEQVQKIEENSHWKSEWDILEKEQLPVFKSANAVEPMLEIEWDQGNGWNTLCPADASGPGGKAYVGCVAVAMAQSLYHIKHPERPQGTKTYPLSPYGSISCNFDNEAPYVWGKMSHTSPDEYNTPLLYHCAVAVEMDFGGSGSGAYTTRVPFAFQRYFGFTPTVQCISRYANESEWVALLKQELNDGNVLIYSGNPGTGEAGHAFNIDGYAPSGYFHFNWGWSGKYNGYFSINNVAPGSHSFVANQKVVIGITTPYWGPTDITLSKLTVAENMPAGTVVGDIAITDYSENDQFTFEVFGAPFFIGEGYNPAKFYVENMQLKTLEVLTKGDYPEVATIVVTDSEGLEYEKRFDITVTKGSSFNSANISEPGIYPNPIKEELNWPADKQLARIILYSTDGKKILESNVYGSSKINLSNVSPGNYVLYAIDINSNVSIQKFVKQ